MCPLKELPALLHSVVVTRCRVCPSDLASRGVVWSKLARVMECYDRLYQDDLTFLVEVGMYVGHGRVENQGTVCVTERTERVLSVTWTAVFTTANMYIRMYVRVHTYVAKLA